MFTKPLFFIFSCSYALSSLHVHIPCPHLILRRCLCRVYICIFITWSLFINDVSSSVQDGQEVPANAPPLMVVNWVWRFFPKRDSLYCHISHFIVKGVYLVACRQVLSEGIAHVTLPFTPVYANNWTPIMSIVLVQSVLRQWLNLPVNCKIVNLRICSLFFPFVCLLKSSPLLQDDILQRRCVPFSKRNWQKLPFYVALWSLFHIFMESVW